jgi:hypothetical protein
MARGAIRGRSGSPAGSGNLLGPCPGRTTGAREWGRGTRVGAAGRPRVAFSFTSMRGKIVGIDMVADPERLRQLDVAILDD